LPGTGGLTRVVDKRKVRRDLADMFCTNADGVKAERAKEWGLVDHVATPNRFPELVQSRAQALGARSARPIEAEGVALTPLERRIEANAIRYRYVEAQFDRARRAITITLKAPDTDQPGTAEAILAAGAAWWPLALARELDDLILSLRVNELDAGLW